MRRVLATPVLSAGLFLVWLVLGPAIDAGTTLLGAAVALAVPWLTAPLRPTGVRLRRPLTAARLLGRVIVDSLQSNAAVAAAIVRRGRPRSAFVRVPLELRDPGGLAVLAVIVTAVPGTAWAELAPDRSALLLHVLAADDEAALVAAIQRRYERPLREIFE